MRFFATNDSKTLFFQRLILALVIFPHGAQKLLGWFGGPGFDGTVKMMGDYMHIPAPVAVLVILAESFGALALAMGAFTRFAAAGITLTMLGAIFIAHVPNGFFMNWSGAQAGEGFEYHLLALALSIPLIVKGAGSYSVDKVIASHRGTPRLSPTPA